MVKVYANTNLEDYFDEDPIMEINLWKYVPKEERSDDFWGREDADDIFGQAVIKEVYPALQQAWDGTSGAIRKRWRKKLK